jgi:predicted phosphodiesterase
MERHVKHFIIPDTQVKPGVKTDHLEAAGNYIIAKQPDVIIHLGDHWDMPSLSSYDKGTAKAEGTRYEADIEAGHKGMDRLFKGVETYNKTAKVKYEPRKVFLIGNHEQRIERHVNANAALKGKLSYKDLGLTKWGWNVYDYLDVVQINGVYYSHYFYNPNTGKPYSGRAHTRLNGCGVSYFGRLPHQQEAVGIDCDFKHVYAIMFDHGESDEYVIEALIRHPRAVAARSPPAMSFAAAAAGAAAAASCTDAAASSSARR